MVSAAAEHSPGDQAGAWTAIVPLRSFSTAKSRLRAQLPGPEVQAVAAEVATGVLDALIGSTAVRRILVVSDADLSGQLMSRHRSEPVEVMVQSPGGGLNEAVTEAADLLRDQHPGSPLLVIHGDLPYLTDTEVDQLLGTAAGEDAFVPDCIGTGSTALLLFAGSARRPAFGAGSAALHAQSGFAEIQLPVSSGLRQDLDTPEQYFDYRQRQERKRLIYSASSSAV